MLKNIELEKSNGTKYNLNIYKDFIIVVVNTATKCGLAPQFEQLEQIYQKYKENKVIVLGFPCNQFANQETVANENMENQCKLNFGVTFPLHKICKVNGKEEHPLFTWLKKEQPGLLNSSIKWNFTKFVIDRTGKPIARFGPKEDPAKIDNLISSLLN